MNFGGKFTCIGSREPNQFRGVKCMYDRPLHHLDATQSSLQGFLALTIFCQRILAALHGRGMGASPFAKKSTRGGYHFFSPLASERGRSIGKCEPIHKCRRLCLCVSLLHPTSTRHLDLWIRPFVRHVDLGHCFTTTCLRRLCLSCLTRPAFVPVVALSKSLGRAAARGRIRREG